MPAQRTKASLGPHSLELLCSKYGTDKLHTSIGPSSSNPTTSRPNPSPSPLLKNNGKTPRHRRPPPPILRGRELGDLTKLGCGLTKLERVHLLLDMPHTGRKSKMKTSRSQSRSSAGMNASLTGAVCSECSQTHRPTEGHSKLQDLKSKLRLVAPRSLPDKTAAPQSGSSSARQSGSQNVVPLPLLHIRFQNQDSGSREFSAEGRHAIRGMLLPQQYRSSVAVWNFRTPGGSLPARSQEFLESADASSRFLTSAGMPPSSGLGPARDRVDTETISTFDADRMNSEQFEYVFDRFSALSTESDYCTTMTPESDTATFSARAQRPSTTDTVVTYQHLTHRWSSRSRPLTPITRHNGLTSRGSPSLSPTTPQHKTHAGKESWPPRFTVRTSWPAVDDPFRFQYLGRGVQRDIMRRLHRSRGGKKRGSQSRPEDGEDDPPQPPQQEPMQQPPQKLDIVLPTDTECHLCRAYECEHLSTPRQGPATTARSTRPPSLSALSVHSRVSECRSRRASQSHKPVVPDPVVEDSDKSWSIEKTCRGDSMAAFDRGHYTAHNVVN